MSGRAFAARGRWHRVELGAVAVEFALVLPLLVMILLGSITSGLAYTHSIGLTNAVREGARFGATTAATTSAWLDAVIARTRETQFDDPGGVSAVCVELEKNGTSVLTRCVDGAGGLAVPSGREPATPAIDAGKCVVKVWGARPFNITVGVAPVREGVMVRGSVARYERAC